MQTSEGDHKVERIRDIVRWRRWRTPSGRCGVPTRILATLESLRDQVKEELLRDPRFLTLLALERSIIDVKSALAGPGSAAPRIAPPLALATLVDDHLARHAGAAVGASGLNVIDQPRIEQLQLGQPGSDQSAIDRSGFNDTDQVSAALAHGPRGDATEHAVADAPASSDGSAAVETLTGPADGADPAPADAGGEHFAGVQPEEPMHAAEAAAAVVPAEPSAAEQQIEQVAFLASDGSPDPAASAEQGAPIAEAVERIADGAAVAFVVEEPAAAGEQAAAPAGGEGRGEAHHLTLSAEAAIAEAVAGMADGDVTIVVVGEPGAADGQAAAVASGDSHPALSAEQEAAIAEAVEGMADGDVTIVVVEESEADGQAAAAASGESHPALSAEQEAAIAEAVEGMPDGDITIVVVEER
ncbi:MAG: hypothetical protein ABSG76_26555, partial [Xanthobacteraceae bacterium]